MKQIYYLIKPLLPWGLQLSLRRFIIKGQLKRNRTVWPILGKAAQKPVDWRGWPGRKQFAVVLTHDVELRRGHNRCMQVLELEQRLGFKSSFNFVPERYDVSKTLIKEIQARGFEVGVHGLVHDGKLYNSKSLFLKRAQKINQYVKAWQAVGFRSPAMHHNLEWLKELHIEYDASTFDTDPFEPQSDGVATIFPFFVPGHSGRKGFVELPYTLAQDFTLFVLMKEKNITIWKKKIDWIARNGGMVLVNTHPDYMSFDSARQHPEEFPVSLYEELLLYLKRNYKDQYWHALPMEVAAHCREVQLNNLRGPYAKAAAA